MTRVRLPRAAVWAELWKWKECWLRQCRVPPAFRGRLRLQNYVLEPAASAAAAACSSDLPGGCIGLTADTTSPREAGAGQALPQLGIFPNISWELWEGERGELQRVLVDSGCLRLSPCVCMVLGGGLDQARDPVAPHHPAVPTVGFGHGVGTGHIRPFPVHPSCGGVGMGHAGSWDGAGARDGGKPSPERHGSGLVPQPGHLPVHDLGVSEVGIAQH